MGKEQEAFFDYGTWKNMFWLMDNNNDIHIRYTVRLDHEIVPELIKEAWKKTVRVYPLIDCRPEQIGEHIYYFKADGENEIFRSKAPIMPGSDLVNGRAFTATYYEDRISVSAYHSLVDGGGLLEVFKTLLYSYLEMYTGIKDETADISLTENRKTEEYYHILKAEDFRDYKPQPLFLYPFDTQYVEDEEMTPGEDGSRMFGTLKFTSEDFLRICKENDSNPSTLLCYLLSKAFYESHPDEKRNIGLAMTINARKVFNLEKYISNCLSMAIIDVSYENTMVNPIGDFTKKIRQDVGYQRTPDYIKTFKNFEDTYGWNHIHRCGLVTYIGTFDIGKHTEHIVDFEMPTNANNNLYLMEINKEFRLMFQFGKVTQIYMDRISKILKNMGLNVIRDKGAYPVITDSKTIID